MATAAKPTPAKLDKKVIERFSEAERELLGRALKFATAAHKGQKRKSGQPYITHPVAVTNYCISMGYDAETVAAALLHDTVEDTKVTLDDIEAEFGAPIKNLVDGVTKLGQVGYVTGEGVSEHRHAASVENIRKLLLAMSRDLRVVMVKLADRRHNLQTLKFLKPEDQRRIAKETLDVYAPLADRLGMGVLKAELEDMAFQYADPEAYKLVKKLVASNLSEAKDFITHFQAEVEKLLKDNDVEVASVHGRQKHLLSIFRKLAKAEGDISKIYDLMALRIIVPEVKDCYQVLGVLHQVYKPLIYRIKDYIAVPKPNGYRSLHTTVLTPEGHITEIQIRTTEMHREAEYGLSARAIYAEHKHTKGYKKGEQAAVNKKLSWVSELAGLSAYNEASPELMEHLKVDLFRDRIFVFSPKGDLYDLPEGATPLDFAFAVHTDVGLKTLGARVNGRMVALNRPLENRDVVEIITRRQPLPNRQWLSIVKTAGARNKIRAYFRAASREANISTGRDLIESQLPLWGMQKLGEIEPDRLRQALDELNMRTPEAMFAAVGEGSLTASTVLRRLFPPKTSRKPPQEAKKLTGRMQVVGAPGLPCVPAQCCNPEPPDHLAGYITRGSGVTVHRSDCNNIPKEPDRLLDCQWEVEVPAGEGIRIELTMLARNRLGLVRDITGLISSQRINIVKITTYDKPADATESVIDVEVEVGDPLVLGGLVQQLSELPDILTVRRTVKNKNSVQDS